MPAMAPDEMPLCFALSEVVDAAAESASAEVEGEVEEVGDEEVDVIVDVMDDSEATDCNEADDCNALDDTDALATDDWETTDEVAIWAANLVALDLVNVGRSARPHRAGEEERRTELLRSSTRTSLRR